ncbi:Protein cereblon [Taenia solium]|eukprot:TsM_000476200 transcript=TsM_000476200 gene=TsM_000476200
MSKPGDESQSESETNHDYELIDGIADGIAMEIGEPISESDINFDRSLPGRHTYLGEDSVAIDTSNHQEPGTVVSLHMLYKPGIVLIPGYTLPLLITNYTEEELVNTYRDPVAILPGCFARPISSDFVGHIATIAYLVTIRFSGSRCSPVLLGRQRLRIMEIQLSSSDNNVFCKGLVLPETSMDGASLGPIIALKSGTLDLSPEPRVIPYPLPGDAFGVFDASHSTWCLPVPISDGGGGGDSGDSLQSQNLSRLPCRRDILAAAADCTTPHPAWVYRQYDLPFLIAEIRAELSRWTTTWQMDKWNPSLAVPFSYWLLQNLPLTCVQKGELLKIDHVVQRLRACLNFIRSCSELACSRCKAAISSQKNVICLSHEGSTLAYVNPHGFIFDMLTLSTVRPDSVFLTGSPTAEYSWFPGYAWTIAHCGACNSHMGWRFTATSDDLRPRLFWGIKRQALVHTAEEDMEVGL